MKLTRRRLLVSTSLVTASLAAGSYLLVQRSPKLSRDLMVGEVTPHTALVQFRLGLGGSGRLDIATDADFGDARTIGMMQAKAEHDFILRFAVTDLEPEKRYFLRAFTDGVGPVGSTSFRTLPTSDVSSDIHVVALGCLNYSAFYTKARKGYGLYQGEDRALGFPGLAVAAALEPDYMFCLGDNVYYDTEPKAQTIGDMRRKWQEMAELPRYRDLFRQVPAYWVKDDHDYRYNDSDPFMDLPVSHQAGISTFREQVPVVPQGDTTSPTFRNIRFGADLEVWFLENRDYRSANDAPDGPDKTIWGKAQRRWLQSSLLASDARFKIIASPNPIIGPERKTKRDNQVTEAGFRTEGEAFLTWLAEHGLVAPKLVIVCSDMHYPYHSRHPLSIDELGTGTLTEGNYYPPPPPDKTSDPERRLTYLFQGTDEIATLLEIRVEDDSDEPGKRRLAFRHIDSRGQEVYSYAMTA